MSSGLTDLRLVPVNIERPSPRDETTTAWPVGSGGELSPGNPADSRRAPWLCAPALQRVCLYRETLWNYLHANTLLYDCQRNFRSGSGEDQRSGSICSASLRALSRFDSYIRMSALSSGSVKASQVLTPMLTCNP